MHRKSWLLLSIILVEARMKDVGFKDDSSSSLDLCVCVCFVDLYTLARIGSCDVSLNNLIWEGILF